MKNNKFFYDFYYDNDILEEERVWLEGCTDEEEAEVAAEAKLFSLRGEGGQFEAIRRNEEHFDDDDYSAFEPDNARRLIKDGLKAAEKQKVAVMSFIERAKRVLEK